MDLREQILTTDDFKYKVIEVPEWQNAKIRIRTMTVGEALGVSNKKDRVDEMVQSIIISVVDEKGAPVFKPEDAKALANKNFKVLLRIFHEINELHEFSSPEQAEKN